MNSTRISDDDEILDGGYLPVNAERIEARLNEIWQKTNHQDRENRPMVKLCLSNVIIVTDALKRPEAENLANDLAKMQPARILLIVIDEVLKTYCSFVRTACAFNEETDSVVCWEIVEILSDPARSDNIAGAVRSLLVDSVPVLTVDCRLSSSTPHFDSSIANLSSCYFFGNDDERNARSTIPRLSLLWYKLLPVRELISTLFSARMAKNRATTLSNCRVLFSKECRDEALLLFGWIISRLVQSGGEVRASMSVEVRTPMGVSHIDFVRKPETSNACIEFDFIDRTSANIDLSSGAWDNEDMPREFSFEMDGVTCRRASNETTLGRYIINASKQRVEFEEYETANTVIRTTLHDIDSFTA